VIKGRVLVHVSSLPPERNLQVVHNLSTAVDKIHTSRDEVNYAQPNYSGLHANRNKNTLSRSNDFIQ